MYLGLFLMTEEVLPVWLQLLLPVQQLWYRQATTMVTCMFCHLLHKATLFMSLFAKSAKLLRIEPIFSGYWELCLPTSRTPTPLSDPDVQLRPSCVCSACAPRALCTLTAVTSLSYSGHIFHFSSLGIPSTEKVVFKYPLPCDRAVIVPHGWWRNDSDQPWSFNYYHYFH